MNSELGRISGIFISPVPTDAEKPQGGFPMLSLEKAELVKGTGIRSLDGIVDRYFATKDEATRGAYPNNKVRNLTLISLDAISRANQNREVPFAMSEARRNIVIDMPAEELNKLVGKYILLGGIVVKGTEICEPCDRPEKLSGKKEFKSAFTNEAGESMGGIRVEILSTNIIEVGDRVVEIK